MPFSWDQKIPGHQATFKEKTIELYIDENRRLDGVGGVREFMKEHYDFDKRYIP
jgi:Clr5 domain